MRVHLLKWIVHARLVEPMSQTRDYSIGALHHCVCDDWHAIVSTEFSVRLVSGVADGVGGWRSYGIDPGEFSSFLMRTCERLVQCASFNPKQPVNLLAYSYCELLEQKKPILGKFIRFCAPFRLWSMELAPELWAENFTNWQTLKSLSIPSGLFAFVLHNAWNLPHERYTNTHSIHLLLIRKSSHETIDISASSHSDRVQYFIIL